MVEAFPWNTYFFCAVGIVISVVLPILRALLPKPRDAERQAGDWWEFVKPYVVLGAFSLIAAFIVLATIDGMATWRVALLAGYGWDSTIQKLKPIG